jgi:hypothetical protein
MALTVSTNETNKNFHGIRITKRIDNTFYQKYYTFKNDNGGVLSKKQQEELEITARIKLDEWEAMADKKLYARLIGRSDCDNRSMTTLGARGITAAFSFSVKKDKTYTHPVIIVRGGSEKTKTFYLAQLGVKAAVNASVDDFMERHDMPAHNKAKIFKAMNVSEAFRFSRLRLNKKGKNITVKQMKLWGLWNGV